MFIQLFQRHLWLHCCFVAVSGWFEVDRFSFSSLPSLCLIFTHFTRNKKIHFIRIFCFKMPYYVVLALFFTLTSFKPANALTKTDKHGQANEIGANRESVGHTKRGFALSAWGIVTLLVVIILIGIFIYYFVLFYPILCRKEGKYDVIEHSRDSTPIPNSNNIEKLP